MAMKNLRFTDKAPIGAIRETQDGYITTLARAVRTGVQEYVGTELGLMHSDWIRVYRPPSEVFSADSLGTFSHAPVTMDHPNELVTSDNWKDLAVGEVSTEALRDGEFIALPLILKDADAIAKVKDGKVELSAGYMAVLDHTSGITPDGEPYDAIQTKIRINHLAIVDNARAGHKARIGDAAPTWGATPTTPEKGAEMPDLKTVVVGDKAVEVSASDADIITKMVADHKTAIDAKDTEIGGLKAEAADAASKVPTPEALNEMIEAHVAVADKAKSLVEGYDIAGKSITDMRRDVVGSIHNIDAADLAKTPDAEIKGIFDFATAKPADDTVRKVLGDKAPVVVDDAGSENWGAIEKQNGWSTN